MPAASPMPFRETLSMARAIVRFVITLVMLALHGGFAESALAQLVPYNPYAETQESLPPVAADGTLNWGSFYKSAAMQQTYERLWGLGACRGTNRAITIPVERNKLKIDGLPEASFRGIVRGAAGTTEGGMVAFAEQGSAAEATPVLVAQLHPAGVTNLRITGPVDVASLRPGMTVRALAQVDEKGRSTSPIRALEVVSPPHGFVPDPVRPRVPDTIVGDLRRVSDTSLVIQVASGKLRRITLSLAPDTTVTAVDASRLDLVSPGDSLEVTGRRWGGEGCMGAGTVFASRLTVTKATTSVAAADRPDEAASATP